MLINIKRFIIKFPIVGNINTSADYWTVSVLVGNATINYTKTVSSGICLGEFKSVAKNEKILLDEIGENSVSIYIGIPFCPTRCLYCSFVSTDIRVSGKYMDRFL